MNLNELANKIAKLEGKKVQVNIAQIKEVVKCFGQVLCGLDEVEGNKLIGKIWMSGRGRIIAKHAKKSRSKENGK